MFSAELNSITNFDWNNPAVLKREDTKCLLEASWWQRYDLAHARGKRLIEELQRKARPEAETLFCLALSMYCIGDVPSGNKLFSQLRGHHQRGSLIDWLDIEILGRSANYTKQAERVGEILKRKKKFPNWVATACIQSLNNSQADTSYLLNRLEKKQFNTPLSMVLRARLLTGQTKLEEAEAVLDNVLKQDPDFAPANWFSGLYSWQMGRVSDAERYFSSAIQGNLIDRPTLTLWLTQKISSLHTENNIDSLLESAYGFCTESPRQSGELASYEIILQWIKGNFIRLKRLFEEHKNYLHYPDAKTDRNARVYFAYIKLLFQQTLMHADIYKVKDDLSPLYVIGESHSLSPCHVNLKWLENKQVKALSRFILGAKMFHFGQSYKSEYKRHIEGHLNTIPKNCFILLTFGEIDCRPDEGILKVVASHNYDLDFVIEKTLTGYIEYVDKIMEGRNRALIAIQGIPAPNYQIDGKLPEKISEATFLGMIRYVNNKLEQLAHAKGFLFLDVYAATNLNGISNKEWHIDEYHLKPTFYACAAEYITYPDRSCCDVLGEFKNTKHCGAVEVKQDINKAKAAHRQGCIYWQEGRYSDAVINFSKASVLNDKAHIYKRDLAGALCVLGQYLEAEAAADAAIAIEANDQLAYQTKAVILADQGRVDEALAIYRELISKEGVNKAAILNAAYANLKSSNWAVGWSLHEVRFHPDISEKLAKLPAGLDIAMWQMQPLEGVKILVVGEQGLGDQLMFCRYLPHLKTRGAASVGVLVSVPLYDTFVNAQLADQVYCATSQINESYDYYVFMGSLPYKFDLIDPRESWRGPYIKGVRTGIIGGADKLKVGIVWSGNTENRDAKFVGKYRFFEPDVFNPIANIQYVQCYSLQYGDAESQLHNIKIIKLGGALESIQDTVNVVSQMDVIITADTSIAHVSGALGKPVIILLPYASDWRWGVEQTDSVWYPSAKLIRSKKINDWNNHIPEILAELELMWERKYEGKTSMKKFLHIGCGMNEKKNTTPGFNTPEWREIRFDINEQVKPDIIGTMLDMQGVMSESMDAIFSSHNIEHLYPHELPLAIGEFLRVLKPDGFLVITCPDLQSICKLVAEDKLTEPAYNSPAGPIAPLDVLYGYRNNMANGNLYMAHKCGFTLKVLLATLQHFGFKTVAGKARGYAPHFDLWAIATKNNTSEDAVRTLASQHFPS